MRTLSLLRAKAEGATFLSRGTLLRLREKEQLWVIPLAGLGIVVGLGTVVGLLVQNYLALYALGEALGRPTFVLFAGLLVAWVFVFVATFPLALSLLYFSQDTRMLLALPLPQAQIVGANVLLLYGMSLPIHLLTFLPAAVIYGLKAGAGGVSIAAFVLLGLVGPLIPLGLSLLVVLAITRAFNTSRHRVAFEAMGMVVFVVVLVLFQVVLQRTVTAGLLQTGGANPLEGLGSTLLGLERWVPVAAWGAEGARGTAGLPSLLLFLAASAAFATLCFAVVQAGYLRQLTSRPDVRQPRRRPSGALVLPPRRSPLRALIGRELSIIASNSTFLFESAGEVLVFPLVLGIFRFTIPAEVRDLVLPQLLASPYVLPIVLGVLAAMAGLNTVSSSCLTREGPRIVLSLSLPLAGSFQLRAKMACYLLLFYPGFLLNTAIASTLLGLGAGDVLALAGAGFFLLCAIFLVSSSADLRRPLFDWTHPQQAMKQNMNVMVGMGLSASLLALIAAAVYGLLAAGLSGRAAVLAIMALAAGASALVYRPLMRYADRRYAGAFGR